MQGAIVEGRDAVAEVDVLAGTAAMCSPAASA